MGSEYRVRFPVIQHGDIPHNRAYGSYRIPCGVANNSQYTDRVALAACGDVDGPPRSHRTQCGPRPPPTRHGATGRADSDRAQAGEKKLNILTQGTRHARAHATTRRVARQARLRTHRRHTSHEIEREQTNETSRVPCERRESNTYVQLYGSTLAYSYTTSRTLNIQRSSHTSHRMDGVNTTRQDSQ